MGFKKFSADQVLSLRVPCPGVKGHGSRQVVILGMSDGSYEVFKSERRLRHSGAGISESKISFNNSMYLMRAVTNAPKGRVVTKEEYFEFVSVASKKRYLFDDENERFVFNGMVAEHEKTSFLTRLEFVAGLKDLGHGATQIEVASLLVKALNNRWSKMAASIGRLAAVDLFIGNYDRFTIDGDLNNPHNLFFAVEGGKLKITGLDSFFDTGAHANFGLGLETLHWGREMNLKALVKGSREQRDYASSLTGSLNKELVGILDGSDLARPNQQGYLFPGVEVGFKIMGGMEDGVKDLLSAIKSKRGVNKNPLQQGVFDRYDKLVSLRG